MLNRRRAVIIAGSLLIAGTVTISMLVFHIWHPRVVSLAVTPDGTTLCIVQECNWDLGEWFTTSFVYQKPGSEWRNFYYDNEDGYWSSARVMLDTNTHKAVFYRNGSPAITFAWDSETYTLHRTTWILPNGTRTNGFIYTNAPGLMPVGWNPEMPIRFPR